MDDKPTMRDRLAAMAMQGMCANTDYSDFLVQGSRDRLAEWAYEMADAMLREREKPARGVRVDEQV